MKLDELLPSHDVAARYDIVVQATLADTAAALEKLDFSDSRLTRLLMGIRTICWKRPEGKPGSQAERLRRAGFVELANVPQKEIVFGLVGRFWRPDSGIVKGLLAEEVIAFHAEGYAKAMWNFTLLAESNQTTRVATETRIKAFGLSARWKFRAYWLIVGPFSGLIRKEMLAIVKRNAEASNRLK